MIEIKILNAKYLGMNLMKYEYNLYIKDLLLIIFRGQKEGVNGNLKIS